MKIEIDPKFILECGAIGHPEDVFPYIMGKIEQFERDIEDQAELFDGMNEER